MASAEVKRETRGADWRCPTDTSTQRLDETPAASLHLTELSATHREDSQEVPPIRRATVKSTSPKFLPTHVTGMHVI